MNPTQNDLSESTRSKVIALCNDRLADAIDLQTQCKYAHWNVKGSNFIALHELFDKVNEDVESYVDLIAERAVQLGGLAEGTAHRSRSANPIDEYGFGCGADVSNAETGTDRARSRTRPHSSSSGWRNPC